MNFNNPSVKKASCDVFTGLPLKLLGKKGVSVITIRHIIVVSNPVIPYMIITM